MIKPIMKKWDSRLVSFHHFFPFACILLIVFDLWTTIRFSVLNMEENSRDTLKRTESQISEYIRSVWNLGNAIALAPATRDASLSLRERAQLLIPYADAYDLFMLGITDREGYLGSTLHEKQITSTRFLTERGISNLSSRPAFQKVMATHRPVLTDTYLAGADGKTSIYTIWIPYYDKAGAIDGIITVSIKFSFISDIINANSLKDNYYFTLVDSRNIVSANPDPSMINKTLSEAYDQSRWASISKQTLTHNLDQRKEGSYWGIHNGRIEYVSYAPISGTDWKLIMRTNFLGSFENTFYSLAIKIAVYLSLIVLFQLKSNRDIYTRDLMYSMLTANIDEVFLAYDLDRRKLIYASSNAERMLGLGAEALMRDPEVLRSGVAVLPWEKEEARTQPMCSWSGAVNDSRQHRTRPFHFRTYRVDWDGRRWMLVVLIDETEEQKQKELLQTALENAEKANLAKSAFLTSMSHDIRTPMNAVVGMTAIAAAHIDEKERVLDCLDKISMANKHLLGLINDVLDMSRIESGKLELACSPFMLSDLCHSLMILLQPQVMEKQLSLFTEAQDIVHESVEGDTLRLNQVFINLAGNAVKFTDAGGSLRIRVQELDSPRPGYALFRFSFTDSGIGIDPAFLPKLFEPFERAESSTVSRIEGSGLGLAICRQLIRAMEGEIHADSEPGKGSCFTVTIPLKIGKQQEEPHDFSAWTGHRLLLVDERSTCGALRKMFQDRGVESETAFSHEEAIRKAQDALARGRAYDGVMLDRGMPVPQWRKTAQCLRDLLGSVPIILMSALDVPENEQERLQAGISTVVAKPVFPTDLGRVLSAVLTKKEAEQPEQSPFGSLDFSARRILLMEDNALNMEIAVELLSMTGLSVESAWNGKEGVDKIRAAPEGYYDMVITDIQMPIMDGYEAARVIRGLDRADVKNLPIIAMTADAFADDARRVEKAGMDDYLTKPIDIDKLMNVLRVRLT